MNPLEYLNTFSNFETNLQQQGSKEFDLTRIVELLDLLGNPQKNLKIIHVAGTKGKGSTSAFLSHILAASGARVGLYTSPHLHSVNERIRILDKESVMHGKDLSGCITDEALEQAINSLRPHIAAIVNRGSSLTYFEVLTAAALYYFNKQSLDWVVLETGLGGRLDATNAVDSMIALITPISLDHTHILGNSIAKIAAEKAGIIKNSRQRVVIAPQTDEAMKVIVGRCAEFGIPPIVVNKDKLYAGEIALMGQHQRINATSALCVIELLILWGHKISADDVARGLKCTRWPARFELVSKNPTVIIDGAHNIASAESLVKTLKEQYPDRKITLILGFSTDKDMAPVIGVLKQIASSIILTKADHPRAHVFNAAQVADLCAGQHCTITPNVQAALDLALTKTSKRDVIVAAGSIFVVAEIREKLKHVSI